MEVVWEGLRVQTMNSLFLWTNLDHWRGGSSLSDHFLKASLQDKLSCGTNSPPACEQPCSPEHTCSGIGWFYRWFFIVKRHKLTVTSWHVSTKERISPKIGVPIFHQPSAGCICWAKGNTEVLQSSWPPEWTDICPLFTLFFSVQEPDCSCASRAGGTSSTGENRIRFALVFAFNIESKEAPQTCVSTRALRHLDLWWC